MPALLAMTPPPLVRARQQRLRERGKAGKQIAHAAMRQLRHIADGLLDSRTPCDPQKAFLIRPIPQP
ncbi:hypothetical protein [Xanthomonas theicola]|uniref:hypothetical protein n=1 Tax=Xanthomonas theicola TaxID=56464 RepID=UPI001FE7C539|nr:hypothetical protein [Xanthomonas theicola]